VIVQAVSGIDLQAQLVTLLHRLYDALQFPGACRFVSSIGIVTGVQLDDRGADLGSGGHLVRLGIDEQGDAHPRFAQPGAGLPDPGLLPGHVQAAFGGQFLQWPASLR